MTEIEKAVEEGLRAWLKRMHPNEPLKTISAHLAQMVAENTPYPDVIRSFAQGLAADLVKEAQSATWDGYSVGMQDAATILRERAGISS